MTPPDYTLLANKIKHYSQQLGFSDLRITDLDLSLYENGLSQWLAAHYHGEMTYMAKHGLNRARPHTLMPEAIRAIVVRMDYLPQKTSATWRADEKKRLIQQEEAVVSIYARGRDYHRVLRQQLKKLAHYIEEQVGIYKWRAFTDSAPIMEVSLAEKAGLGWRGKHTLLLTKEAGSTFFIGEILTDLPLPIDTPKQNTHCGSCTRCIDVCPTQAIVAPYQLDARRCIAYLTIELKGSIPLTLRPLIGNRIYGCDDCQLYCPWNKFAQFSAQHDFNVRHGLDKSRLIDLFRWDEATFMTTLLGSPIRRIGYEQWLRNIAVGLGNARRLLVQQKEDTTLIDQALEGKKEKVSMMVQEHINWALNQNQYKDKESSC